MIILTDPTHLLLTLDLVIFRQEEKLVAAVQEKLGCACHSFIGVGMCLKLKKRLQQDEKPIDGCGKLSVGVSDGLTQESQVFEVIRKEGGAYFNEVVLSDDYAKGLVLISVATVNHSQ